VCLCGKIVKVHFRCTNSFSMVWWCVAILINLDTHTPMMILHANKIVCACVPMTPTVNLFAGCRFGVLPVLTLIGTLTYWSECLSKTKVIRQFWSAILEGIAV